MNNETKTKLPSLEKVHQCLHEGDSYTYKQLTCLLNIFDLKGKAKIQQVAHLERYFAYEKQGTKYIITKIFDEIEPVERALRSDAIYARKIEILLLNYLRDREDGTAVHTLKQWFELLGMINKNYIPDCNKRGIVHEEIKAPEIVLFGEVAEKINARASDYNYYVFFDRTTSYFTRQFRQVLASLSKSRHVITYNDVWIIHDGNTSHKATEEETKIILETYQEVMQDIKIKEMYQLYQRGPAAIKSFYNQINTRLFKALNLTSPYARVLSEIEIIYSNKYMDQQIEYSEKKLEEVMQARYELNKKCYNWSNHNAEAYKKRLDGEYGKWFSVPMQKDLSNYYIRLPGAEYED